MPLGSRRTAAVAIFATLSVPLTINQVKGTITIPVNNFGSPDFSAYASFASQKIFLNAITTRINAKAT
jgi:hypothetical protein